MTLTLVIWQVRSMTPRLASRFSDYMKHHQTPGNKIAHSIGVPLIVCSLLGLLSRVTFGSSAFLGSYIRPDFGWIALVLGTVYYLSLDWKLALPFSLVLVGLYMVGRSLSIEAQITLQIIGWAAQYVGHLRYEKKSPAFYKNLTHLLIGPFWLFARVIRYGEAS